MHYVCISTHQFIPCYASAVHKHMHTRILKPSEDSEPTGLFPDTDTEYKTALNSGLNGPSAFTCGTSVKIVERESVKQFHTNELSEPRPNMPCIETRHVKEVVNLLVC